MGRKQNKGTRQKGGMEEDTEVKKEVLGRIERETEGNSKEAE